MLEGLKIPQWFSRHPFRCQKENSHLFWVSVWDLLWLCFFNLIISYPTSELCLKKKKKGKKILQSCRFLADSHLLFLPWPVADSTCCIKLSWSFPCSVVETLSKSDLPLRVVHVTSFFWSQGPGMSKVRGYRNNFKPCVLSICLIVALSCLQRQRSYFLSLCQQWGMLKHMDVFYSYVEYHILFHEIVLVPVPSQ